ncbi:MAG: DUF1464 family protein, partial [Longimicrobiales bacterium]
MPRVLGLDPGTLSIDVCGLDDGALFVDETISTTLLTAADEVLALMDSAGPVDLIVGPSGYGLPLVTIDAVGERELALAFLPSRNDGIGLSGLRTLVRRLRDARLPVVFAPGVIHLPTIPLHRKINRIDLGTADKVCAAALAIHDQAARFGIGPAETAFVLVELGGAFTAVLGVESGAIVDGAGGSSGPPGRLSAGALDAEVACLLGRVGKEVVFSGGAAYVAGAPDSSPEALATATEPAAVRARTMLVEGVVKAVATQLAIMAPVREILLSGRLAGIAGFFEPVAAALARYGPVRLVSSFARRAREAAQG